MANGRMRLWLMAAVVAAPVLTAATAAGAQDFSGRWDSNMGGMRMYESGGHVSGRYEMKGGRIEGEVDGDALRGIWTQDSANHRCLERRLGSHYWGRFRLELGEDGDSFQGRWSYCDDERGSGGDWTGTRRHHRDDD